MRKTSLKKWATITLMMATTLVGCGGNNSSSIDESTDAATQTEDPSGAAELAGATLLDVRDISEFESGHLPDAMNIPFNDGTLESSLASMDKNTRYVVYCRSGNRSSQAVALMKEAGFTDVTDLGGLEAAVAATGQQLVTE